MPEEPSDAPPAGGEGGTPPSGDPNPPGGEPQDPNPPSGGEGDTPPSGNDFQIPDEYKDKPWASKVKSQDDLWKQVDNLQGLAGKKHAVPDWENATPQEIETYLKEVRPEEKSAYKFSDAEDHETTQLETAFQDMLYEVGIPAHQGNQLIQAYQALEQQTKEQLFDKDAFLSGMESTFGSDYETKCGDIAKVIADNLNDDQKARLEGVPNEQLTLMYELVDNIQRAYGGFESGAQGEGGEGAAGGVDVDEVRKDLRDKIQKLSRVPHSAEEKQKLVDQLDATYRKRK